MRFRIRPLTFALALAGLSAQAHATDLVQAYDLARDSDPQFAASEALKNAQGEGVVQSRSALLPQVNNAPSAVMTAWLLHRSLPDDFELGQECELRDPGEEGGVVVEGERAEKTANAPA